ncbi:MAG: translation initiation factor IF-5A [Candidatus Methanomethylicota archaeon]|jgi:translation initiation factor 5A|uniref:Translation initiation factor 5A n=1 Tax=Thermoproteota archaeon TaxID=2056631 RepID=A0A520KGR1_9CREN|nr:MAG: translation initiation factor IF-5A [Candidatus Verstraetearchaeota archaeon]TDA37722.1 MAG: translation initiation factor IF-5A [Candidatus Verstraetearchaeota archaeon]
MSTKPVELGDLKEGSFVIIDNTPCRVVSIEKSKTGKHGSAKARVTAIGLFDGVKRSIVAPTDQKVEVPIIEKKTGQVLALLRDTVQIMDLQTYETFEVPKPKDEEILSKLSPGTEIEYWEILNKKYIMRVK